MENCEVDDQRWDQIRRFLEEHASLLSRQGSIIETWRFRNGRRLGPYFRLSFRDQRRQRSLYLGTDQAMISKVVQHLKALQSTVRLDRQLNRTRAALRRELTRAHQAVDAALQGTGLHRKGNEVRGWRCAVPTEVVRRYGAKDVEIADESETSDPV